MKEYIHKFNKIIPKVLIRNKVDVVQEGRDRNTAASIASQLNITVWKECSAKEMRIKDAVDAMLDIAMNPNKGLT